MHETLIAQELIRQVNQQAKDNCIARVTRIGICLGKDSELTEESINSWFDIFKKGTVADHAVLDVSVEEGDSVLLTSLEGEEICPQAGP